jgi:hypothetical protein
MDPPGSAHADGSASRGRSQCRDDPHTGGGWASDETAARRLPRRERMASGSQRAACSPGPSRAGRQSRGGDQSSVGSCRVAPARRRVHAVVRAAGVSHLPDWSRTGSQQRAARHRLASLPEAEVVRDVAGYPVTSLARTASDLVAGLELPQALVVLDAAARSLVESFVTDPRRRDYLNPRLIEAARDAIASVNPRLDASPNSTRRESPRRSRSARGTSTWQGCPRHCVRHRSTRPWGRCFRTSTGRSTA